MIKLLPLLVIGLVLFTGVEVFAIQNATEILQEYVVFSTPSIIKTTHSNYSTIELQESTAHIMKPNEPLLPVINKKYTFPFGTKIHDVDVVFSGKHNHVLAKKLLPAPAPVLLLENEYIKRQEVTENETVYAQKEAYPTQQFTYSLHAGLDGNTHVIILNLHCYPIQYIPETNIIYSADSMEITIVYETPKKVVSFPDIYDLMIISPKQFFPQIRPLIDHKNNMGINTTHKSTEDIYRKFPGRDTAEQIKNFIKYAIEEMGITYVLLVGGMKSQLFGKPRDDKNIGSKSWYVPVRYTNLYDQGSIYDPGYISDLYYADIFKIEHNETVFDTWDSNNNSIFAEWKGLNKDIIDHYPDIYLGRLPCRNSWEVKTIVDKIITYETTKTDPSWFQKIILVGGDSHDDTGTDFIEGELVCDKAASYIPEFKQIKLYATNKGSLDLTPTPKNISKEISKGAGFILFDGHGSPGSWNTHWVGDYSWSNTPGGISIYNFPTLINRKKLPIALIGGCHNSQFNVTLFATLLHKPFMWTYGSPVPECFSWWLTRKIGGGAIAALGSTGLGYGYVGNHSDIDGDGNDEPDALEGLGGYIEIMFFNIYSKGREYLGEVWGTTISNYLDVFPPMNDMIQMKCIQGWPLLGDPSLRIGGYLL
jgi:hypothetical protein